MAKNFDHLVHQNSAVSNKAPDASKLLYGEIAVNYPKDNEKLYIKNSSNEVIPFIPQKAVESKIATAKSEMETWVTGKGYVTSSGVTSVATSGGNHVTLAGGTITSTGTITAGVESGYTIPSDTQISTWDGKQDAISDLETIRSNASNGNTAYGWGNHATKGYLTAHQSLANYHKSYVYYDSKATGFTYNSSSLQTTLSESGEELHYIIYNSSNSSSITVGIGASSGTWIRCISDDNIEIDPNKYGEINVLRIGNNNYVRAVGS